MLIYHLQYTLIFMKKKWSIIKMNWNFRRFTKVSKMYFGLYKVKIDIYIFIQGINAQITSIQCLKHMFDNIQKICIETFLLTLLSRL